MSQTDLILVADIGAPHGVQGEFRLNSHMQDPEAILEHTLRDAKGQVILTLTGARGHKGGIIARAKEVPDRTAAEKARGTKLYVLRQDLPDPEDGEFYISDLIGLEARDAAGKAVGRVRGVDNFGAGDIIDIQPLEGPSFYVPFTHDHVPDIRLSEGFILVVIDDL